MTGNPQAAYAARPLDRESRNTLVEDYLPLVHHVLGRLPIHLPQTLDREDLFEVGVLGLIGAANSYNPGKGAAFKTHAFVNIRGAILDELRKHDAVPRSRRDRLKHVGQQESLLEEQLGRPATTAELADACELSVEQVEDVLVHAHGASVLSLDEPAGGGGDDGSNRLVDALRMPESPEPSQEAELREMKSALRTAIAELPERERHIVILYYAKDLRLKEIGEVLDVTESRVCQLHARAIRLLNKALTGDDAKAS